MNLLEFLGQRPGCKTALRPEYHYNAPYARNVPNFLINTFPYFTMRTTFEDVNRPKFERPFFRAMLNWSMGHLLHTETAPAVASYIEEFIRDKGFTPAEAIATEMGVTAMRNGFGYDGIDPLEAVRRAAIGLMRVKSAQGKLVIQS